MASGALWLRQVDARIATIVVIAINLRLPSSFGPHYTTYWHTVEEEIAHPMSEVVAGVWWTSHSAPI